MAFCALWLWITSLAAQAASVSYTSVSVVGQAVPVSASAVALDGAGNIYVTDSACGPLTRLAPGGGHATSLAGTAFCASGLTADQSGNAWVVDNTNDRLVKIDASGNVTYVSAGVAINSVSRDWSDNVYYSTPSGTYIIAAGTSTPPAATLP